MDIVERLRRLTEEWWECCGDIHEPLAKAADEIERLREEHHDVRILNEQYFNENEILIDEIERLREKYEKLLGASVAFQIAIHNAVFVFDKELDGILKEDVSQTTRMHDSHAQMSDDKGQR